MLRHPWLATLTPLTPAQYEGLSKSDEHPSVGNWRLVPIQDWRGLRRHPIAGWLPFHPAQLVGTRNSPPVRTFLDLLSTFIFSTFVFFFSSSICLLQASPTLIAIMAFEGIDPETLALIIELQLSDARSLTNDPGKSDQDGKPTSGSNRRTTENGNAASGQSTPNNNPPRKSVATNVRSHESIIAGSSSQATSVDGRSTVAESLSQAASQPGSSASEEEEGRCIACGEAAGSSRMTRSSCSHEYCPDCLTQLFRAATTDESLFPPRCCKQPIPIEPSQTHLPVDPVTKFKAKEIEYSTPNRTYCHETTCSTFIPPTSIQGDTATCPDCAAQTCVFCKT